MFSPEHLDEILDGGVGFVRDVSEGVMSLNQSASDGAE